MAGLPTPILISPHWTLLSKELPWAHPITAYVNCLRTKGITLDGEETSFGRCHKYIAKVCPPAFTTNPNMGYTRGQSCYTVLYTKGHIVESVDDELFNQLPKDDPVYKAKTRFGMYFTCMAAFRIKAQLCAQQYLDRPCSGATSRVVTTMRSSMFITRSLVALQPHSRLVHLVRDPRAVAFYRWDDEESFAYFEEKQLSVLAKTYCDIAANQIAQMRDLKLEHPRQILGVSYDKLLHRVSENFFYLLRYMNIKPSLNETESLGNFLRQSEVGLIKENYNWAVTLHTSDIFKINHICDLLITEMTQDDKNGKEIQERYFL
jgi:hypothetical protein